MYLYYRFCLFYSMLLAVWLRLFFFYLFLFILVCRSYSVSFLLLYACLIQLRNDPSTFIHSLMTISMISNKQTYALYPNHLNASCSAVVYARFISLPRQTSPKERDKHTHTHTERKRGIEREFRSHFDCSAHSSSTHWYYCFSVVFTRLPSFQHTNLAHARIYLYVNVYEHTSERSSVFTNYIYIILLLCGYVVVFLSIFNGLKIKLLSFCFPFFFFLVKIEFKNIYLYSHFLPINDDYDGNGNGFIVVTHLLVLLIEDAF